MGYMLRFLQRRSSQAWFTWMILGIGSDYFSRGWYHMLCGRIRRLGELSLPCHEEMILCWT